MDIASEMDENIASEMDVKNTSERDENNLFENAMKGQWGKIVEAYKKSPNSQGAQITKGKDTALHIAVSGASSDIVGKLVGCLVNDALKIKNVRGDTALHVAAAVGNVEMCHCMASKDHELVGARNYESETPIFLAALHGHMDAFLCLHSIQKIDSSLCRRKNGDTILHSTLSGEYFRLAFQIIKLHPDLVDSVNENGLTPRHILASKPNAFKSSCRFGRFDRIIYYCTFVDRLKAIKYDHEACSKNSAARNGFRCPENYETCIKFFKLIRNTIRALAQTEDEENPRQEGSMSQRVNQEKEEGREDRLFPPNFATCARLFRLMMKALLIVLGRGSWMLTRIKEKKERHTWAHQIMTELVQRDSSYKSYNYQHDGRNPGNSVLTYVADDFSFPETPPVAEQDQKSLPGDRNVGVASHNKDGNKGDQMEKAERVDKPILLAAKMGVTEMVDKFFASYPVAAQELKASDKDLVLLTFTKKEAQPPRSNETPLLIAAKMGVTEIVKEILERYPVAVQDLDSDGKNVVLLAIEHRQTEVYNLLLNRKILRDSAFRQVDNNGNGALHLASRFGEHRPWLIPGAALQMQWEIKWYKLVKKSMPPHFFSRHNNEGKTPKKIFTETHEELVTDGREWLTKTAESCSVVATLIASVAYATSASVPGGISENTGKPVLENEPIFNVFAMASLVALCCSVTAVVFFLTILTSRFEDRDFAINLPRKLLLGLTFLFTSIVAMLISFCSGHFYVITNKMRSVAYPIYAAACLPITFFALSQLPLYFDLLWAIFRKVPQRSYKVLP